MDIRKKQKAVVTALEDVKARDITAYNVEHLTALFDRVIIATGESARQVKSLARNVFTEMAAIGERPLSIEGEQEGEWVLVDLGDIIVHVMHPAVRQYYNLEELWGQTKPRSPRAPREAGEARDSGSAAPRKTSAKRAPRKSSASRTTGTTGTPRTPSTPGLSRAPRKPAASRAPSKPGAPRARKKTATKSA